MSTRSSRGAGGGQGVRIGSSLAHLCRMGRIRICNQSCPIQLTFWLAAAFDAMATATEGCTSAMCGDCSVRGWRERHAASPTFVLPVLVLEAVVGTMFVGTFCCDIWMMTNENSPCSNPERQLANLFPYLHNYHLFCCRQELVAFDRLSASARNGAVARSWLILKIIFDSKSRVRLSAYIS